MPLIRKTPGPPGAPALDAAAMLSALASGTDDERWMAARAMHGLPDGARALAAALGRERDARVREAIFTSLAKIPAGESIELIIPFVRSDDAQLRTGALDALRAMKQAVWPYLPRLLQDGDADVRLLACELARVLPGEEAARLLCALLEAEPEHNVCAAALEVLAEVGGPECLPVLARCETRFRGIAFLEFSIKITAGRIRSQSPSQRA